MRGRDENDGAPDELVGESVAGSSDSEAHRDHGFVGHGGRVVAEERDDLLHPVDRMRHEAFGHCRTDGMQPELERGDDAEVGAGSAHTPEEVGVLVLAGADDLSVRGDEFDRQHVIGREPVLALKASHPAAEREPGDAGVTHVAERTGKPESRGFSIEITAEGASADSGEASLRIDTDLPHPREVDNDSPSQVENPPTLWPPARTAITRSCSRANRTALMTSAASVQRATRAGRRSTIPFHTARAASYSRSSVAMTSPSRLLRKAARAAAFRGLSSSWAISPPAIAPGSPLAPGPIADTCLPQSPRTKPTPPPCRRVNA